MSLEKLKASGEAPQWMTEVGFTTLSKGYLLKGETPKSMYKRVSRAAANRLNKPELEPKFFDIIWKNWLCLASPVASNMGTERGLPVSCNSIHVGDSLDSILMKNYELGMLSKYGAGVGVYLGDLRGRGSAVNGTGGTSDGVVSWAKIYDSTIASVSQGATRRGAAAVYLPVNHPDIQEFLQIRKPTGDINKRCMNLHHGVCIDDEFMNSIVNGHQGNRKVHGQLLAARFETGEPYFFFSDNVERQKPECYRVHNLKIKTSNICNEIYLYTDPDHTFVCCLSSMNLARWDEWKDTDAVQLAVWFLDAVMEEYIQKAKNMRGFESSVRFAQKSRAIGLGALGWHSLLQELRLPFDCLQSSILNNLIFKRIHSETEKATKALAEEYGEPEWCKGFGRRNSHCVALAPTVSNSLISGGLSPGIEPIAANVYVQNSAKGTFIVKNPHLERFLVEKNMDTPEVWSQINKDAGSVLGVKGLSKEEKDIFLTAREINQFAIVRQAGQRQKWIDQGQSVNLFFGANSDPKYVHEVHLEAWKVGLKGLYYCRTESVLRADLASRSASECVACEA
jgi:ribonucleoside-diphosphate reductase alpha chain